MISLKTNDEDVRKFSLRVDCEIARIITLINDMLDLSRLELERKGVPISLSLRNIANDVIESLSPLANQKSIRFSLDGDAHIIADREHMIELIKNLTENAVRYNRENGEVHLSISDTDNHVTVSVTDTGIGIPKEHLPRIFERFYRVNKSRSRETGGTGLGLSIVKHIAEIYNADITISSEPDIGTNITIVFPRIRSTEISKHKENSHD